MENNYQYIDSDYKYTNKNGVLHNLENIEDEKILLAYKSLKVSKRVEELFENPIKINDSNSLLTIHHYLFQDVYENLALSLYHPHRPNQRCFGFNLKRESHKRTILLSY